MNKLIELLNEYVRADFVKHEDGCFKEKYMGEEGRWDSDTEVISKEYGFIKRLVGNDKIDLLKLTCMNPRYTEILDSDFSWEDRIIMILSIQDNPIEFLVSILK